MRAILFILIIFFEISAFGQDSVEIKVSKDICACLENIKKTYSKDYPEDFLPSCFQSGIMANGDLFKLKNQPDSKESAYQEGRKIGENLANDLAVKMVYTCNTYFQIMDTARYDLFDAINKDSVIKSIQILNKTDSTLRNEDFYMHRGVLYFQVMDIDKALKDFNAALSFNSMSFQSTYFKAWCLEIKKEYDEAYKLYSYLALMTNKNDFNVLAAIAKRKKSGL